jgi:hypothetical protein
LAFLGAPDIGIDECVDGVYRYQHWLVERNWPGIPILRG